MESAHQLTAVLTGRYEIEREIGRGGMATVYLARDIRHNRLVALKVLDPELGVVLGAERFLSEIRVTAKLQHPNLLPLFDSGEAAGLLFYVMPYVEGETLRARLVRERQLPIAEAVRLATVIAGALDYAHRQGVIHRDLKPENILLHDGQPLVADFGIALAVSNAGGQRVTQTGLSLGTPQYMSPEQATGDRVIDARTDVYSLGAVTYEMIAGEPPHTGSTAQAIIARLMTEEPRSLAVLRRSVPLVVDAAVLRALEKLPADRFATAREFGDALGDPRDVSYPGSIAARSATAPRRGALQRVLPWTIAGLTIVAAVAFTVARGRSSTGDRASVIRFPIALGANERLAPAPGVPFTISNDDRTIAYVGQDSGSIRLMVRSLDKLESRSLPGTEGFQLSPTLSPDGQWIALAKDGRIIKIPTAGGPVSPVALPTVGAVAGMAWLADGTIVASVGGKLVAVPAAGGAWRTIATPDSARDEIAQWGPHLLPDGKRLVYIAVSREGAASNRIAVVPLAGGRQIITGYRGTTALGAAHGHAIWVTMAGAVAAVPLNALTEGATGEPIPLLEGVLVGAGGAAKAYLSSRGTLVYQSGQATSQLMRVDRNGVGVPITTAARAFRHPRYSPDGSRIVVTVRSLQSSDIWLCTVATGAMSRLTPSGDNDFAEWSGDGKRVVYHSVQADGQVVLRWLAIDGSTSAVLLKTGNDDLNGAVLTADGRTAVFRKAAPARQTRAIVARDLATGETHEVIRSGFSEIAPRLSPDGRWIAYMSDESGGIEVMVAPLNGTAARVRVSTDGGTEPQWSRDGKTLYYSNNRSLMAASFTPGSPPTVSNRTKLFASAYLSDPTYPDYDVAADGRLLMLQGVADDALTLVVLGWEREVAALLKKP